MHHLSFDNCWHKSNKNMSKYYIDKIPSDIINEYTIEIQTDEEVENDLLKIKEILYLKKIIIVSHYNSK